MIAGYDEKQYSQNKFGDIASKMLKMSVNPISPPPPTRRLQIEKVMHQLSCEVENYSNLFSELVSRLKNVAGLQPVIPVKEETEEENLVPLCNDIRMQSDKLKGINLSLERLIQSLEI